MTNTIRCKLCKEELETNTSVCKGCNNDSVNELSREDRRQLMLQYAFIIFGLLSIPLMLINDWLGWIDIKREWSTYFFGYIVLSSAVIFISLITFLCWNKFVNTEKCESGTRTVK